MNSGSNDNLVLINETGYKQLKIGSVNEAIGQQFFLNDSTPCQVLGVIKDFHFQNFKRSIGPMIFRYDLEKLAFINARVHSSQIDVFTDKLTANSMVKKLGYPVDYILWDVIYRELQSHEGDVLTVTFFTLTFLIIGCLGLIGIVTYSTNQRIKEITVRKILGANALQIFSVLTKEYFLLILISLLVGLPLGYMLSREYLNEYTYRINIDLPLIFFTFIVISLIGLVILGSVTLKNCVAKPINNLNR